MWYSRGVLVKIAQLSIALAVMFAAIYAQETLNYPINGYLIGVWGFVAAYGATYLYIQLSDWRVRRRADLGALRSQQRPQKSIDI